jgi:hypothetical protein
MKKKRSSFTLDEVVGASIPMADDLTALEQQQQSTPEFIGGGGSGRRSYYSKQSSSSSSSSPYYYSEQEVDQDSEYDNDNSSSKTQGIKSSGGRRSRYIVRRASPPLACADDLLSDSEISELEKRVARGDFLSSDRDQEENGQKVALHEEDEVKCVRRDSTKGRLEEDNDKKQEGLLNYGFVSLSIPMA